MQYTTYNDIYLQGVESPPILDLLTDRMSMPDIFQSFVYLVEEKYTARPDLFSLDMYGTTEFAWLICRLNDIENPLEFNAGMKIWMPSADELWRFIKPAEFNSLIEEDYDDFIDEVESVNDDIETTNKKQKKNNNKQYIKVDKSNGRIVF